MSLNLLPLCVLVSARLSAGPRVLSFLYIFPSADIHDPCCSSSPSSPQYSSREWTMFESRTEQITYILMHLSLLYGHFLPRGAGVTLGGSAAAISCTISLPCRSSQTRAWVSMSCPFQKKKEFKTTKKLKQKHKQNNSTNKQKSDGAGRTVQPPNIPQSSRTSGIRLGSAL